MSNTTPQAALLSAAETDQHLDAVLKGAGSALRHYTTEFCLSKMRAAMQAHEAAILAKLQATQEPAQAGELPDEREAFEAWLLTLMDPDPRANCCIETATELRGDGHYVMAETRIAWDAWQARAALSARKPLKPEQEDDPVPPEGKRWFYCTTSTNDVAGWQRWRVAATSFEEAKRIFSEEGGEFDSEELEVQGFDEPEWDDPDNGIGLEVKHADQA